jgi:16S rRNA (cytosine967-C5)-methyltransferase
VILRDVRDEVRIGFETFHPCWFVEYCFKLFGRNEAIAMLKADIKPPPTYLRINTLKAEESEILKKIGEEGIEVEELQNSSYIYKVASAKHLLTRTESFREGFFCIQDKTSGFVVEAANPKSGMTVLDLCSAPGVKTTYLAQLMHNHGTIFSLDCSRRRMTIWAKEVARAEVDIALPIIADIRRHLPFTLKADLLVLDPPCTSTGVLGKLPSHKWRLEPYSIARMAEIQWEMINNTAEYVKTKGVLIYSTCSITIEENEMIVERFLKCHPEFSLIEIIPNTGCPGLRGLDKCRRFYPHIHECSGFFIAKLLRNDDAYA